MPIRRKSKRSSIRQRKSLRRKSLRRRSYRPRRMYGGGDDLNGPSDYGVNDYGVSDDSHPLDDMRNDESPAVSKLGNQMSELISNIRNKLQLQDFGDEHVRALPRSAYSFEPESPDISQPVSFDQRELEEQTAGDSETDNADHTDTDSDVSTESVPDSQDEDLHDADLHDDDSHDEDIHEESPVIQQLEQMGGKRGPQFGNFYSKALKNYTKQLKRKRSFW